MVRLRHEGACAPDFWGPVAFGGPRAQGIVTVCCSLRLPATSQCKIIISWPCNTIAFMWPDASPRPLTAWVMRPMAWDSHQCIHWECLCGARASTDCRANLRTITIIHYLPIVFAVFSTNVHGFCMFLFLPHMAGQAWVISALSCLACWNSCSADWVTVKACLHDITGPPFQEFAPFSSIYPRPGIDAQSNHVAITVFGANLTVTGMTGIPMSASIHTCKHQPQTNGNNECASQIHASWDHHNLWVLLRFPFFVRLYHSSNSLAWQENQFPEIVSGNRFSSWRQPDIHNWNTPKRLIIGTSRYPTIQMQTRSKTSSTIWRIFERSELASESSACAV